MGPETQKRLAGLVFQTPLLVDRLGPKTFKSEALPRKVMDLKVSGVQKQFPGIVFLRLLVDRLGSKIIQIRNFARESHGFEVFFASSQPERCVHLGHVLGEQLLRRQPAVRAFSVVIVHAELYHSGSVCAEMTDGMSARFLFSCSDFLPRAAQGLPPLTITRIALPTEASWGEKA